jgi:phosphoesterase RecJ-like protein
MFIETRNFIRISLRSRPDVDASAFASRYFDGGGHKNAAGGKSMEPMAQTVERFRAAVAEFFSQK